MSGTINTSYIQSFTGSVITIINSYLVPLLFAVALLTFFWGVYKYFIQGGADAKAHQEGAQFVLWSVIGFVVILALWGLVAMVGNTFGLSPGGGPPAPPTLTPSSGGTTYI
jgi:uncharacterized paraquat-inducible protein A